MFGNYITFPHFSNGPLSSGYKRITCPCFIIAPLLSVLTLKKMLPVCIMGSVVAEERRKGSIKGLKCRIAFNFLRNFFYYSFVHLRCYSIRVKI